MRTTLLGADEGQQAFEHDCAGDFDTRIGWINRFSGDDLQSSLAFESGETDETRSGITTI
jgi:hypothetical protein